MRAVLAALLAGLATIFRSRGALQLEIVPPANRQAVPPPTRRPPVSEEIRDLEAIQQWQRLANSHSRHSTIPRKSAPVNSTPPVM